MNSENRALIFNVQFNISTVSSLSGSYPSRIFVVTVFNINDNLDSRGLLDANVGDIVIDSSRNRFIYQGFNAVPLGLLLLEDPWDDIAGLVVPPYSTPAPGSTFLFRMTPNCQVYQHGRVSLGIPETIVEYLSQKTNYQFEERVCGTGPTGFEDRAINFLGSTAGVAPVNGQTGGIPGDRDDPLEGDEWVNPGNGDRFVYQDGMWQLVPCCVPVNILGTTGTGPVNGQTGGITDRPFPVEGDEWVDPENGERYIYQDGRWQLAPCCSIDVTGPVGPIGQTGLVGFQGDTGPQGATGAQGIIGVTGDDGPTGFQGPQGVTGAVGDTGLDGPMGVQGSTGAQGVQGLIGDTGDQGELGAQGPQGATGLDGETGAEGPVGATGAQGVQGVTGATGEIGLVGDVGAQGAQGERGMTGSMGDVGFTGDVGPQGEVGVRGVTGAQGEIGATGDQGMIGATGLQGMRGPTGDCSPLFLVEAATGETGAVTSGPVVMDCGDTLRLFSEGNLEIEVTQGSSIIQIEPRNIFAESGNPNNTRPNGPDDPTRSGTYLDPDTGIGYMWDTINLRWVAIRGSFDIYRYGATGGFHNPSMEKSAIVRSLVDNNISVVRSGSSSVIINGFAGYTYTVTIPSDDDIFHMTLVDQSPSGEGQSVARFIFVWEDTTFEGNVDEQTLVSPTVLLHQYGNGAAPDYTVNTLQARTPNSGGNLVSCYNADSRTLIVDVQLQDVGGSWYGISFGF